MEVIHNCKHTLAITIHDKLVSFCLLYLLGEWVPNSAEVFYVGQV